MMEAASSTLVPLTMGSIIAMEEKQHFPVLEGIVIKARGHEEPRQTMITFVLSSNNDRPKVKV